MSITELEAKKSITQSMLTIEPDNQSASATKLALENLIQLKLMGTYEKL